MSRRWLPFIGAAAGLSVFGLAPAANAGCGGWGCQPACEGPAWFGPPLVRGSILPCAPLYPLRPVYRVEQGPIHNVVVVPYEEPHLRLGYLPRRFFADSPAIVDLTPALGIHAGRACDSRALAMWSASAAAFETLRLWMRPGRTSLARTSQVVRVNCRKPLPSAPSTRESGSRSGAVESATSASLSRPTIRKPRALSASKPRAKLVMAMIGTYSSAPEADLARTPVASGLWREVVTSAFTANAAAERRIAPTL